MAGNANQIDKAESASGVTNADIWAALDNLVIAQEGQEESPTTETNEAAEPLVTDKGHGAEVKGVEEAEESAGGENAGDEEAGEEPAEAEQEEEEEPEELPEEAAEETEDQEDEEPQPKGIREMEKRIHKLTARSKGLEEENTTLKSQLEKAQPITLSPSPGDPLAHLNSAQEVVDTVNHLEEVCTWCTEHLDGGEIEEKDGLREYSAEEVRKRLAAAQQMLRRHVPARMQYLEQKARYDALCKQVYPELFNAQSEESKIAWTFLRQNPEILKLPQYALIIGDAIRGGRLREEEAKAKAKASPAGVTRPGAPRPAGQKFAPRAISPGAAKNVRSNGAAQAHQRFLQTGSKKDLEAYLERTLAG